MCLQLRSAACCRGYINRPGCLEDCFDQGSGWTLLFQDFPLCASPSDDDLLVTVRCRLCALSSCLAFRMAVVGLFCETAEFQWPHIIAWEERHHCEKVQLNIPLSVLLLDVPFCRFPQDRYFPFVSSSPHGHG